MPISLILTPFDHFHFRPTSGLLSSQDLTQCPIEDLTDVKLAIEDPNEDDEEDEDDEKDLTDVTLVSDDTY